MTKSTLNIAWRWHHFEIFYRTVTGPLWEARNFSQTSTLSISMFWYNLAIYLRKIHSIEICGHRICSNTDPDQSHVHIAKLFDLSNQTASSQLNRIQCTKQLCTFDVQWIKEHGSENSIQSIAILCPKRSRISIIQPWCDCVCMCASQNEHVWLSRISLCCTLSCSNFDDCTWSLTWNCLNIRLVPLLIWMTN